MARVHNISHITSRQPMAVNIGLLKIRPGKCAEIPDESINAKTTALHGVTIWIGNQLPPALREKAIQLPKASSMGPEQVSSYLMAQSLENLQSLLQGVTPAVTVKANAPHRRYVYTLRAICFSDEHQLDPELFSWLGRWERLGNGDYREG